VVRVAEVADAIGVLSPGEGNTGHLIVEDADRFVAEEADLELDYERKSRVDEWSFC